MKNNDKYFQNNHGIFFTPMFKINYKIISISSLAILAAVIAVMLAIS
jgi:hypothetical protein